MNNGMKRRSGFKKLTALINSMVAQLARIFKQKIDVTTLGVIGDGIVNDSAKIMEAQAYAISIGVKYLLFPDLEYLISPALVSVADEMTWEMLGNGRFITKETEIYNVFIATAIGSKGVKLINVGFDQRGDADLTPIVQEEPVVINKGCHLLHISNNYDIELNHCRFWSYGVTAVLSQPFDTYGKYINVHDCTAYYERKTNSEYDVSVFNLDAMKVDCKNNETFATKRAGVTKWMPETAYEIHCPKGRITDNDATGCKNGVLHVGWPMLYTKYDAEYRGKVKITDNNSYQGLIGVSLWGAHTLPGIITRNVEIAKNYLQSHLGGHGFKPGSGIEFRDGLRYDASFFRNIKVLDNIIEFTYSKYTSLANKITFTTNTIITTGDDFKDFAVGDYVLIIGCTVNASNNKSLYITGVAPKQLSFAAGSFVAGAETAVITVRINYTDSMALSLAPEYCGAIKGVTNNSIEGLTIEGNIVYGWPWAALHFRALQERGTNQHKRIKAYNNDFTDCAYCVPYVASGIPWQGEVCIEDCSDVDIQFNTFTKGGTFNKTCIKLLSIGDHGVSGLKFLNNKVSTLTAREIEYESLPVVQAMITDVPEFLALGCPPEIKPSGQGTALPSTAGTIAVTMNGTIKLLTPTGDCTLNATGGVVGQSCSFKITTSGVTSFNITFGTNFKSIGVLATGTTTAKTFIIPFICDGTTWWEDGARTGAM